MPLFGNLLGRLRARHDAEPPKVMRDDELAPSSGDEEPSGSTQPNQTVLTYVTGHWVDGSSLADTADATESRIMHNPAMHRIDSEYRSEVVLNDHTQQSYVSSLNETEEVWQYTLARKQKCATGSLKNFSAEHLRDRQYLQHRLYWPLGRVSHGAWYQAHTELRALELENEAVTQSATAAATRTDILQGQYVALDIKIQRARRRIAEMRKRIEEHKANLMKDTDEKKVEGD